MKKIIAMIITVAMLFALVTIGASADDGHYVWNHTGDFPDDPWNQTFRIGHDCPQTGTIRFKTDVSFSKVLFAKIWASAHAVVTLEVISDGNTVSTVNFELYNEENGSGDVPSVEVDLGKTLPAGEYTFKFSVPDGNYAFFAYGNDPLPDDYIDNERGHAMFGLWTTDSGSGFVSLGLVIEEKVVDVYKGSGDGGPQNLQGGAIAIVVTVPEGYTLAEIIGQNSPTWGKNDGGSDAQAEVYAWDGDYDSSVDGAVLATAEITDHADNADAVFAFENALPAGTYLIEFSSTGDMAIGFWSYGTAAGDPVVFVNGSETTAFYPKTAVKLVIAEPAGGETTDEPAGPVVHGASFDSFFVNDVLNFGQGDGAASSKLDAVNRTVNAEDGSVQTITIRGWIGFEDQDIAQFGYKIGKNAPVFSDSFTEERGDIGAIQDPGNGGSHAQAFKIVVDVLNVYGSTKIVAVAKLADGTVVEIDESVPRNGEGTTPNTSFTFVGPADPNPETVPATGDATIAMFAVIVVLAMGAAVVFMKKRAF